MRVFRVLKVRRSFIDALVWALMDFIIIIILNFNHHS
jgi:hypothetical protein